MNIDLTAIQQQELTLRYREARQAWHDMRASGSGTLALGDDERRWCDRLVMGLVLECEPADGWRERDRDLAFREAADGR